MRINGDEHHLKFQNGEPEFGCDGRVRVSMLDGKDDGRDKLLARLRDVHKTPRRDEVDLFTPPVFHRGGRWTRR